MNEPRTAKLAFVTQPTPGEVYLNLQFEEPAPLLERVRITHDSLCTLAADAVVMALGWRGQR